MGPCQQTPPPRLFAFAQFYWLLWLIISFAFSFLIGSAFLGGF